MDRFATRCADNGFEIISADLNRNDLRRYLDNRVKIIHSFINDGRIGTIKTVYSAGHVGVKIDDRFNHSDKNGYYYYPTSQLYILKGEKIK